MEKKVRSGRAVFDKWKSYKDGNTDDVPMMFMLPQVTIQEKTVYPKKGDRNYDAFIGNTYDAWRRGDLTTEELNGMPWDIRNNVLGERNKRAVQEGLNNAANEWVIPGMMTVLSVPTGLSGLVARPMMTGLAVVGGIAGGKEADRLGWNEMIPDAPAWVREAMNPGAWIGGMAGGSYGKFLMGKRLVGQPYNGKGVRYLEGMDLNGTKHELPIRTMRGGVKNINGNIVSDEELVANWKRSQDFYNQRLMARGERQRGRMYTVDDENAIRIIHDHEPGLTKEQILDDLEDLGGAFAEYNDEYGIVTKKLNTTGKQRRGTTNSASIHEKSHLMRSQKEIDKIEDIKWSNLSLDPDEAAARGTQIKSMLGIKDNTPITPEQLRYMKDNYVRLTGNDNFMQAFLNSIQDFDEAARWLSKHSYSLGGAMNLLGIIKHPRGRKGF